MIKEILRKIKECFKEKLTPPEWRINPTAFNTMDLQRWDERSEMYNTVLYHCTAEAAGEYIEQYGKGD